MCAVFEGKLLNILEVFIDGEFVYSLGADAGTGIIPQDVKQFLLKDE